MNKGLCSGVIAALVAAVSSFSDKPMRPGGEEPLPGWPTNALKSLEFGVLLEVESFASRIDGENQSDIVVATAAFDLELAVNEWMLGHIGLLWEQDSRENDHVDEAYLAFGASETIPYYLVAGRFYPPVGNFESVFISDPLTLELMEMNRTAAMVGFVNAWFDVNAGAFNGDTKPGVPDGEGGDSTISDFFASVSLTPVEPLQFGAYWLSDLMETYNYGMIGEDIADQAGYETGGLKYEASDDLYTAYDRGLLSYSDKFPGQAFGAVIAYQSIEYAPVAAEFLHLEELDHDACGDVVTVQLGMAF